MLLDVVVHDLVIYIYISYMADRPLLAQRNARDQLHLLPYGVLSLRSCESGYSSSASVSLRRPSSIHLQALLLPDRILERINGVSLWIVQLNPPPIIHGQRVLLRIIQSSPAPSPTPQLHLSTPPRPLDPKADVNAPMHLVDLTLDPWVLARKVYLVPEFFAYERVGAQGVEGGGYDRGFLFLVVEEGEEGERHADYEDWEGFQNLG
jgi:hypothetical protein